MTKKHYCYTKLGNISCLRKENSEFDLIDSTCRGLQILSPITSTGIMLGKDKVNYVHDLFNTSIL